MWFTASLIVSLKTARISTCDCIWRINVWHLKYISGKFDYISSIVIKKSAFFFVQVSLDFQNKQILYLAFVDNCCVLLQLLHEMFYIWGWWVSTYTNNLAFESSCWKAKCNFLVDHDLLPDMSEGYKGSCLNSYEISFLITTMTIIVSIHE